MHRSNLEKQKAGRPLPLRSRGVVAAVAVGAVGAALLGIACLPSVPAVRPATVPGGRLQLVGGVRVLTLQGTPEQRGAAQGKLLGPQVRAVVKRYVHRFVVRVMGGWRNALWVAHAAEPQIPTSLRRELRALARAARVRYDELLVLNTHVDALASGCSSITVQGPAAAGGRVLLARNLDWMAPPGMENLAVVVVVRAAGAQTFASYTYPGFLGVLTAVSGAGVAVSMNVSNSLDRARRCHPTPLLIRAALGRATSAAELLRRIAAGRRCSGFLITAADGRTGGRVLEMTARRSAQRLPRAGLLLSTNHFRLPSMRPLQGRLYANSRGRLRALKRWLRPRVGVGGVGASRLWRALRTAPVKNRGTIMSVIIDPARFRMRIWERGSAVAAGQTLDLRPWLGSAPAAAPPKRRR